MASTSFNSTASGKSPYSKRPCLATPAAISRSSSSRNARLTLGRMVSPRQPMKPCPAMSNGEPPAGVPSTFQPPKPSLLSSSAKTPHSQPDVYTTPHTHSLLKTVPGQPRAAIKAFCLEYNGFDRTAITDCQAFACPLWFYRPYQTPRKVSSKQRWLARRARSIKPCQGSGMHLKRRKMAFPFAWTAFGSF